VVCVRKVRRPRWTGVVYNRSDVLFVNWCGSFFMLPKVCPCECPYCVESWCAPTLDVLYVILEGNGGVICYSKDLGVVFVWDCVVVQCNVRDVLVLLSVICKKCCGRFCWSYM
jgi:hypothetical protein